MFARLRNIAVMDANSQSLHRKVTFDFCLPPCLPIANFTIRKEWQVSFLSGSPLQAVSIVGEEVFSFKLCLYPGATEAERYSDTSRVDGKVTLRMGCIQIVYLHQFFMSLLVGHTHTHTLYLCCKVLLICLLLLLCVVATFTHHKRLRSSLSWLDLRHQSQYVSVHCGSPIISAATVTKKGFDGSSFLLKTGVITELI